jgi:cellulose synthase/poly-beta-1,6-N-acetylglucosamine synthase-like glycosyltransferase
LAILANIVIGFYIILTILIGLFCLSQFVLFIFFLSRKKHKVDDLAKSDLPFVTIQLPIFNEKYVAERIINAAIEIDYPSDKIEIQVLDDSTDETQSIAASLVRKYKDLGKNIQYIHRNNRQGFKAGALKYGMELTPSKYFCIFDADFVPGSDFLLNVMPYFQNPEIGVVQTKWGHINETENLLTLFQAFQLNVHFTIEQGGRYGSSNFLQFNGTAGIWRRGAIEEGHGWQSDTLTEDLDLSYRSQLKGWKIVFCEQLVTPAELPSEISGLKSQQFRWMKGGAQTAKKLLPIIWASPIELRKKLWSSIHLLSSTVYLFLFLLSLLSVPIVIIQNSDLYKTNPFIYLVSMTPFILITSFYANVILSNQQGKWAQRIATFIVSFPLMLAMNLGLALHNAIAVLQGWSGIQSEFKRTPKKGSESRSNYTSKIARTTYIEGIMVLYFALAIVYAIWSKNYSFVIFHVLCLYGYLSIFSLSLISKFRNNAAG